jgi:hypothetical protein
MVEGFEMTFYFMVYCFDIVVSFWKNGNEAAQLLMQRGNGGRKRLISAQRTDVKHRWTQS